jgi:thioredoxin 1
VLEEIAGAHGDKLAVYKLDIDSNPTVTSRYGVTSIPTMNVYVGGEVVKTFGALSKTKLLRELEDFICD